MHLFKYPFENDIFNVCIHVLYTDSHRHIYTDSFYFTFITYIYKSELNYLDRNKQKGTIDYML